MTCSLTPGDRVWISVKGREVPATVITVGRVLTFVRTDDGVVFSRHEHEVFTASDEEEAQ